MAVLVDTNVLSALIRGDQSIARVVFSIDSCINSIIYIELIQGSISKADVIEIERYLALFPYYAITEDITSEALRLIRKYSNSNGLMLADSFIAATCLIHSLELLTFNRYDFDFIKGIRLMKI